MAQILPMRPLAPGVSGRVIPVDTTAYFSAQGLTGDARAFIFFTDGRVYSAAMTQTPVGMEAHIHTAPGRALAAAVSRCGAPVLVSASGKRGLLPQDMACITERIASICSQHAPPEILPPMPPPEFALPPEPEKPEPLPEPENAAPEPSTDGSSADVTSENDTSADVTPIDCPCDRFDGEVQARLLADSEPLEGPFAPHEAEIERIDPFYFKNESFPGKRSIFFNAFPGYYPELDWEVLSMPGCDDYLRAELYGRTLTAVPYAPSQYPPAGLPGRARYISDRCGKGYWVY